MPAEGVSHQTSGSSAGGADTSKSRRLARLAGRTRGRRTGTGPNNVGSSLECTPYNGSAFGGTATSGVVDWGVAGSDAWIP